MPQEKWCYALYTQSVCIICLPYFSSRADTIAGTGSAQVCAISYAVLTWSSTEEQDDIMTGIVRSLLQVEQVF